MQAYLHLILGFSSKLLTPSEFERALDHSAHRTEGTVKLRVEEFSETNDLTQDWSTIVSIDFGSVGESGKLVSTDKIVDKVATIRETQSEKITEAHELLRTLKLAHLIPYTQFQLSVQNY